METSMVDPTNELKIRAEILQKRVTSGDAAARTRLRALTELAKADDDAIATFATSLQRKHCLAVVARECGFSSWDHASRVLRGDSSELDFGTLLSDKATGGTLNAWFVDYSEARRVLDDRRRADSRAYLLAYRRQFVVVDIQYVEGLGLDPDDPDWVAIDFDWPRPRDRAAWTRLIGKRLAATRDRS